MHKMIFNRISNKTAQIGVLGLGYVGLPVALLCIKKGFTVIGIDADEQRVKKIQSGRSYIADISDEEIRTAVGCNQFKVTINYDELSSCDVIFICISTPLTHDDKPDYSYLFSGIDAVKKRLKRQQLIIIESTIAPGVTESEILSRLSETDFSVGKDFFLVYSPERLDPGNKAFNVENTPKLVAGITAKCSSLAELLYKQLGVTAIPVKSAAVAETAKLLENIYRDVNIALINEMTKICHIKGIDIWDVITAASTKPFGFQAFYPGPGVGGHCVPVDSIYYTEWARKNGFTPHLVEKARKINDSMPYYISRRLEEILLENNKKLNGSKIFILGVTYKKDTNDLRGSPVKKLIEILTKNGVKIYYHDPFIKEMEIKGVTYSCIEPDEDFLMHQDCIVFAVPHTYYNNIPWFDEACHLIFDLTGVLSVPSGKSGKIIRL